MPRDAASFWDQQVVAPQSNTWLDDPIVHDYANRLIGRGEPIWSAEWFMQWIGTRRFDRALSVGCGGGALERALIERDIVHRIDAFDGSLTSLHVAQREAASAGMSQRIGYFASDFDHPVLPAATYDLVLFHQSAHHVRQLERLFRAVLAALTPDGVVYLDEYVGPARLDWTPRLIGPQREIFHTLPADLRLTDELLYPIHPDDPSEAVRSSEIEGRLRIGFEIVERRPYGGTLLSLVYPLLRRDRMTDAIRQHLIEEERRLMDGGLPPFYAVMVARPRRGNARRFAHLMYPVLAVTSRVVYRIRELYRRLSHVRGLRRIL